MSTQLAGLQSLWLSRYGVPGPERLFSSGLPGHEADNKAGPGTTL